MSNRNRVPLKGYLQRTGISEVKGIAFSPPGWLLLRKDKREEEMDIAK